MVAKGHALSSLSFRLVEVGAFFLSPPHFFPRPECSLTKVYIMRTGDTVAVGPSCPFSPSFSFFFFFSPVEK